MKYFLIALTALAWAFPGLTVAAQGTDSHAGMAQACTTRPSYHPLMASHLEADRQTGQSTSTSLNSTPAESSKLKTNLAKESKGKFLKPNQAFKFSLQTGPNGNLIAHWYITPGYHLYRDQIKFKLEKGKGLSLGKIRLPHGKSVNLPVLGQTLVYDHPFSVQLPVKRTSEATQKGTLQVRYQGCADKGICYAPITKQVAFTLKPGQGAGSTANHVKTQGSGPPNSQGSSLSSTNEQDKLAYFLLHKPLWMSLGLFFLLGLGLAFTPCIFPLFPILSGIIIGQRETPSTGRTFVLSLIYVLAMAFTYTAVGVIVGLTGASIQAWFQNPWVLSAFAGIFVVLSLSMFGFYDLQMPAFIQSRLTEISNRQQGGSLIGVGVMGFLSALIVGPCVTAPLVATLIVIANTGNAVLGGLSLFSLSMGMGLPLLLICTACGRFLPKAGPWMDKIKYAFGVLMLGVAIWMLARFIPAWSTALLTGLLLVTSGVYMGAFDSVNKEASGWLKLWKGFGIVFALWGGLIFVGLASGGNSVFEPLSALFQGSNTSNSPVSVSGQANSLSFTPIKSNKALTHALKVAHNKGKPVMIDYYASWCVDCKELDAETFSNPKVQQALAGFTLLQVNVTADSTTDKALLKRFNLFGPPGVIFFNAHGQQLHQLQVVGFMPPKQFVKHIEKAKN
ncbi:protein-disulfide reductase DsbD [Acidihalobacter prosperus]